MKVLLVSIKAGFGHHSTANALIDRFSELDVECEMADMFEQISRHLSDSINDSYLLATKYLKGIYGIAYSRLAERDEAYDRKSVTNAINVLISLRLMNFFKENTADVIIATHSFAATILTELKNRGCIKCPIIGIVTDFTIHPYWECTDLDYYVLPDMMLAYQLEKKGIDKSKMLGCGIPVRTIFAERCDKAQKRAEMGIANKTTLLVMMGSMGFGHIEKFVQQIDNFRGDFQIICVCGTNDKSKAAIDSGSWEHTVYAHGFVSNIYDYMDISDILITKPGGLTTSEAMAKGLPCIITNPIPGHEYRNMDFLVNNGAAVMVNKDYPLDEALNQILNFPWRLELLRESVRHIGKPNACEDLCAFIINKWGK